MEARANGGNVDCIFGDFLWYFKRWFRRFYAVVDCKIIWKMVRKEEVNEMKKFWETIKEMLFIDIKTAIIYFLMILLCLAVVQGIVIFFKEVVFK